uniref:Uncharacterized protein n=1 Tax=Arundo donax TaxID=35708 RepID=A0A0A9FTM1_ARUDO
MHASIVHYLYILVAVYIGVHPWNYARINGALFVLTCPGLSSSMDTILNFVRNTIAWDHWHRESAVKYVACSIVFIFYCQKNRSKLNCLSSEMLGLGSDSS